MFEAMTWLQAHRDGVRLRMLREPRGYPAANCNLVLPASNPEAVAGYVIMEQVEYPGMSGTNTMCVVTALLETGALPMTEPLTELTLEAPAGLIRVQATCSDGKVNLADAYARIERDEAWLIGAHIAPFEQANRYNHEPKRIRKLLLHRGEIDELLGKTKSKGLTIVPLRLYLTGKGRAKLELGLARGKQLHDRRRDIADRESRRDIAREMADAQRGR